MGQLLQVGGDVHGGLGAAVHTADAAGGEDADAGKVGDNHGGGDGGGAVRTAGHQRRQVAAAGLGDAAAGFAEVFDLVTAEACLEAAADHGDRGGHGAVGADRLLDQQGGLDVFGIRHAVGNDRALQGNDGLPLLQGVLDLRRNIQITIHRGILSFFSEKYLKILRNTLQIPAGKV